MAYIQNEEELKQGGAGGQVLAGSGGAAGTAPAQAVGSGFTNLQTYLTANKGQGQGVASDITTQGQKAVDAERAKANTMADAWADAGTTQASQAGEAAANPYNTAAQALQADPFADFTNPRSSTYGGPKTAQDVGGYNDLEKAYQNVKNTATGYAGDYGTQKAGLQQKYGYGSGFAALDTFLGRQDGKDQIQGWAAGVNPGSAEAQVAKVNSAIAGGQKAVSDAQANFQKANTDARDARTKADRAAQPAPTDWGGQGIASKAAYDDYGNVKAVDNTNKNAQKNLQRGFR